MKRTIVVIVLALGGCAPLTTQMEACSDTGCADPDADKPKPPDTLKRQAAFDLQCDASKLSWTAIGDEERAWGVRGCGKQASYVVESRCSWYAGDWCNWILNSPVQPVQPSP